MPSYHSVVAIRQFLARPRVTLADMMDARTSHDEGEAVSGCPVCDGSCGRCAFGFPVRLQVNSTTVLPSNVAPGASRAQAGKKSG